MEFVNKFFEAIRLKIIDGIEESIAELFKTVNREVLKVQSELSMTPETWNTGLWGMTNDICDSVIKPVAGAVLACFMCFEIITLMNDKNNLHSSSDIMAAFTKFFIQLCITLVVVQNTSKITMGIFKIAAYLISGAADYITGSAALDPSISSAEIAELLKDKSLPAVIGFSALVWLERFILFIVSIIIRVAVIGRMLEIYIFCSIAPIPLSTFAGSGELNSIGKNYLKNLAALALQGFLMMMCIGFYTKIVSSITTTDDFAATLFELLVCAVALTLSLVKSASTAKSILTAH